MRLFLKDNYLNVFKTILSELSDSTKPRTSFVKLWHKVCSAECDAVGQALQSLIATNYKDAVADIEKVVKKFRGNLGEIFAEAFFMSNLMSDICDGTTYEAVDPDNERFVDADVISNATGLKIGVQVKNYDKDLVLKEIFDKALAEDAMRIRLDKLIPSDRLIDYLSSPHQMIFSFTDAKNQQWIDSNSPAIMFIGPKDIDAKRIQGDARRHIAPNIRMFKNICEEIESMK